MFLDKDLYISFAYKPCLLSSLYLKHTLACSLGRDLLETLASMYIGHFGIVHLSHMEMDYRDQL